MNVLICGSGAREHALGRCLLASPSVQRVIASPGNPGMAIADEIELEPEPVTIDRLAELGVDLVVSASRSPLPVAFDQAEEMNVPVVFSGRYAAELDENLLSAKEHMLEVGIPTPRFKHADELALALSMIDETDHAIAVKACAPVKGRRVFVCTSRDEAKAAVENLAARAAFDTAGVLLEEALAGTELSVAVLTNGHDFTALPPVWLFSRGAGAVAPHPAIDAETLRVIEREIIKPSIDFVALQGWRYRGFLTFRMIVTNRGPYLLEYATQLGDPEAQALMPLIDGDLGETLSALAAGDLVTPGANGSVACAVELYATGSAGEHIADVGTPATPEPFYGAVRISEEALVVAGTRVATVVGEGDSLEMARDAAYRRALAISFPGLRLRHDIGGAPIVDAIVEEGASFAPQFARRGGVLPVVVQEIESGDVLMVGYANLAAVRETRRTGRATLYSTSRKRLWTKGETSGNWLEVVEIRVDCDQDALLYRVVLHGAGVCHTTNARGEARRSCFYRTLTGTIPAAGPREQSDNFGLDFIPDWQ